MMWPAFLNGARVGRNAAALLLAASASNLCIAAGPDDGPLTFRLGAFRFSESKDRITAIANGRPVLAARVLPGGDLMPDIHARETDELEVGSAIFRLSTGRLLRRDRPSCSRLYPRDPKTKAAQWGTDAVVLKPLEDTNGRPVGYEAQRLDLARCRVAGRNSSGLADFYGLFEFRASAAGWWAVSSQDAALKVSRDGLTWTTVPPPLGAQAILAARWRSRAELWVLLSRPDPQAGGVALRLARTSDLGQNWDEAPARTAQLPPAWFEATRLLAAEGL